MDISSGGAIEINSIVNLATTMATTATQQTVSIAMLKKTVDLKASSATTMLEMLRPVTGASPPTHLGQHVNTAAQRQSSTRTESALTMSPQGNVAVKQRRPPSLTIKALADTQSGSMSVSSLTLENHEHVRLAEWLSEDAWVVACLCAAWCDTCCSYRDNFDRLAALHPDKRFVWIDIEDQADVVGDIDVENFPTLLMQRGDIVAFFGTILPDRRKKAMKNCARK
jgi:hypothetical protein